MGAKVVHKMIRRKPRFCIEVGEVILEDRSERRVRCLKFAHLTPKEAQRVQNKLVVRHNGGKDEMHHAKFPWLGVLIDENAKNGEIFTDVFYEPRRATTGSWKSANKNACNQWARHGKRNLKNVKHLNKFDVMRFDKEVDQRRKDADNQAVSKEVRDNPLLAALSKRGYREQLMAYHTARFEIELRREENDDELALRGPSVYHVTQEYDSRKSVYRIYDKTDDLQYWQDMYEPRCLEDLGYDGVWSFPFSERVHVATIIHSDRFGNQRPKLVRLGDRLHLLECFRSDAYENEDRDDCEMSHLREYAEAFAELYDAAA